MEPLPRVFDMLQYFQTFLLSLESLWRPVTSPNMVAILTAILDFTKNQKSSKNGENCWFFLCA